MRVHGLCAYVEYKTVERSTGNATTCSCARSVRFGFAWHALKAVRDAERQRGVFSFRIVNSADMNFSVDRNPGQKCRRSLSNVAARTESVQWQKHRRYCIDVLGLTFSCRFTSHALVHVHRSSFSLFIYLVRGLLYGYGGFQILINSDIL